MQEYVEMVLKTSFKKQISLLLDVSPMLINGQSHRLS